MRLKGRKGSSKFFMLNRGYHDVQWGAFKGFS